jgi:hypothetical protein
MTAEDALQLVLAQLDRHEVHYMVTGSFASNVHGVPRTTYDADIVIESSQKSLDDFLKGLGEEFYADPMRAREAREHRSMFNVVHLETGFKIDLIVKKDRPFSQQEFSRREKIPFLGQACWFATAEDVILAKLEWSKQTDSEKQFLDAMNIAKVQGKRLDVGYLKKWATELGVQEKVQGLLQGLV